MQELLSDYENLSIKAAAVENLLISDDDQNKVSGLDHRK